MPILQMEKYVNSLNLYDVGEINVISRIIYIYKCNYVLLYKCTIRRDIFILTINDRMENELCTKYIFKNYLNQF